MFLYKENGEKIRCQVNSENIIGKGQYGSVHRLSVNECIKIYSKVNRREIDIEMLKAIKEFTLRNFYEIHEILYSKENSFKGYTMKYYGSEELDILEVSTEYTIYNMQNLLTSIQKLTENNIYIHDMHDENVIINSSEITVIDMDLYTFNKSYNNITLRYKNISALQSLLSSLYQEALKKYHPELSSYIMKEVIKDLFQLYTSKEIEITTKKLKRYKYPIDYIKKQISK